MQTMNQSSLFLRLVYFTPKKKKEIQPCNY
ncbi:hypothetical protein NC651_029177 [Populus alba x Populus x berolinensis]|nr:hypothetical protein NC651_029177 [Populus alba x Populus x berolinensis]